MHVTRGVFQMPTTGNCAGSAAASSENCTATAQKEKFASSSPGAQAANKANAAGLKGSDGEAASYDLHTANTPLLRLAQAAGGS